MGSRYEDQPPEHWAGAASLDPTPVWKQYLVVVLLLFGALAVIAVAAALALAPQLATPPALVPGDRLVLARALGMTRGALEKARLPSRPQTPRLAYAISRMLDVSVDAVLAGHWIRAACPHCGGDVVA